MKTRTLAPAVLACLLALSASAALGAGTAEPLDYSKLPSVMADQIQAVLAKARALDALSKRSGFTLRSKAGSETDGGSNALQLPILSDSPRSQVAAGTTIALPWYGGKARYRAQVLSGTESVVTVSDVPTAQAVLTASALAPKTYSVQITDSAGATVSGSFDVVPDGPKLSSAAIEKFRGLVPAPVFAIAKATLYAKQGRQYYLQAYQLISPYLEYPDAAILGSSLATGASL